MIHPTVQRIADMKQHIDDINDKKFTIITCPACNKTATRIKGQPCQECLRRKINLK